LVAQAVEHILAHTNPTRILLSMHYTAQVGLAFDSVESIMRDANFL
jgi:quinol-cytochrome oxidoreductase complex cytochrome b subunit